MVFEKIKTDGFEQIIYCQDNEVGLRAIIALHSLALGPATGGCRMWNYASEDDALHDVLRLSKGMTYKASVAGLNWGGGKSVIIGDPKAPKNPKMLERFGEYVERLGGNYITAKDVGIGAEDLRIIKSKTSHVLGIDGEPGSSGDPSPSTAWGVYHGMKASAQHALKTSSLKGLKIALQGLGSVSYYLLEHLVADGAEVIGCDIDKTVIERAVNKYKIEIVSPDTIYDVKCDIFAPAALGSTINKDTLPRIQAKIIAGPANNQLATEEMGYEVLGKGMVYAPDYVINGGGLINIYYEEARQAPYSKEKSQAHVTRIGNTIRDILERAQAEKLPSHVVADKMAEERVQKAKALRS